MDPSGLRVLYEDEAIIALDKPAGIHTAPLEPGEGGTLLEAAIARYPEIAALPGRKPVEPGVLHRLDRETSGVVIVARTAASFQRLLSQFESGAVTKEYMAGCSLAASALLQAAGDRQRISSRFAPWGPGRKKVRVVTALQPGHRQPREVTEEQYTTDVEVLAVAPEWCSVRCLITRGFRHQVRAHLAHIHLPILGDPLYGVPVPEGFPARMYLHATAVELAHPATGSRLRIESPVPSEMRVLLAR